MKKILLTAVVFAFSVVMTMSCLAQETVMDEVKSITGKVVEVTVDSTVIAKNSGTVSIADELGRIVKVVVTPTSKVLNASMVAVTLDNVKKDDSIKVKYLRAKNGSNEATSIDIV